MSQDIAVYICFGLLGFGVVGLVWIVKGAMDDSRESRNFPGPEGP